MRPLLLALVVLAPAFAAASSNDESPQNVPGSRPAWMTDDMEARLRAGETVVLQDPGITIENGIRPGTMMTWPSWCTMDFILEKRPSRERFIGSAGHCTPNHEGGVVEILVSRRLVLDPTLIEVEFLEIGTVEHADDRDIPYSPDFAAVRIYPELYTRIKPEVIAIGGPCGVDGTGIDLGESFAYYGHGPGQEDGAARTGVGRAPTHDGFYRGYGQAQGGDSGSPVVMAGTLAAGGILNQAHTGLVYGVEMWNVLASLNAREAAAGTGQTWRVVDSPRCVSGEVVA